MLFARIFVILYATVLTLVGVLVLLIAAIDHRKYTKMTDVLQDEDWDYVCFEIFINVIGGIVIVVGLLGYCCPLQDDHFMTMGFQALLVFIFVSQLVVGVLCFWYQQNETSDMLNTLLKWVLDYNKQPSQMTSYNLFVVQNELKCCGYFGVDDFQNVSDDAFPGSCCSSEKQNCSKSSKYTIKRGCKDELAYAISDFTNRIGGLALVTALLAVLGLPLALLLARPARDLRCLSSRS